MSFPADLEATDTACLYCSSEASVIFCKTDICRGYKMYYRDRTKDRIQYAALIQSTKVRPREYRLDHAVYML